jgi:hypothetical protein
MNKLSTKIKYFALSTNLIVVAFKILIKFLVLILPKINREKLIKIGKKKNTICIVEEPYEVSIKTPNQSLAKERFKNSYGQKKVDCFFGVKIKDVRLIGPYGIPFTRKGQVILEPISKSWLNHVLATTIIQLGFFGFFKEYLLAIFPIFASKKNFLEMGAYLICRGSKIIIFENKQPQAVFGHWLGEQLPQLRGIEGIFSKFDVSCPLIVNKNPKDWQIESLELMGYKKDNLYELTQKGLRVGEIIISSLRNVHSKQTEFDPKARKWAAKRLQSNFEKLNFEENNKKNISLFRQNENNRRISNYEDVRKIIFENHYYETKIENQSLFESAKNFFFAQNYLSIYGSGILRIMFMKQPKKLIEIYTKNESDRDVFFLLASEFGMEYECVTAQIVQNNNINNNQNKKTNFKYQFINNDWYIPIFELKKSLSEKK